MPAFSINTLAHRMVPAGPWLVAGLALVVFAVAAPGTFINGDAVVYASQIRDADFTQRTTHLGYYLIAYPVSLLPVALTYALNILNCVFGAGAVLFIAFIAEEVTGSRLDGSVAALVAASGTLLVGNALHAEVYMAQAFFLLAAIFLWLRGRSVLAGAFAAAAFLISSSSLFAIPFFALMRPKPRDLAWLLLTAGAISAAALLPVLDNYIFGARGMLSALEKGIDYKQAALKSGQDVFFGFYAYIPMLVAGIIVCWRREDYRQFLLALTTLWLTVFAFGEKFADVPVQLTTYILASILVAIGIRYAAAGSRVQVIVGALMGLAIVAGIVWVTPLVPDAYSDHLPSAIILAIFGLIMCLYAVTFFISASPRTVCAVMSVALSANLFLIVERELEARQTLSTLNEIADQIEAQPDALVVAKWNTLVRLNWLVAGEPYRSGTFDVDELVGSYPNPLRLAEFRMALPTHTAIFLMEHHPQISKEVSEAGYREGVKRVIWTK